MRGCGALAFALLVASTAVAGAQDAGGCRVSDPTGTPLNVRTKPHGAVVGILGNGGLVAITDQTVDRDGRAWVFVVDGRTRAPLGWVFRDYIHCP